MTEATFRNMEVEHLEAAFEGVREDEENVTRNTDDTQNTADITDQSVSLDIERETSKQAEQQQHSSDDQDAHVVFICIHGQAFQCKPQIGIPFKEFNRRHMHTGGWCSCSLLNTHAEVQGGEGDMNRKSACAECGKMFSENASVDHLVTAPTDNDESDTNTANINTNTAQQTIKRMAHNLENKQQIGHDPGSLSCPECGKIFTRQRALWMHMKQHGTPNRSKEKDDMKGRSQSDIVLPRNFKLPQHEDHSSYCKMQLVCEECPKVFNRPNKLRQHKATHLNTKKRSCTPESKELSCIKCSKVFSRPDILKRHKLHHAKVAGKVLKCVLCLESFEDKIVYKAHEKRHLKQNQGTEMKCKVCQKVLKGLSTLRRHTQIHNEDQFSCRLGCNSTFAFSADRTRHEVLYCKMGEKFLCSFCGKVFGNKSQLQVHEIKFHWESLDKHVKKTKTREYQCPHCSKVFSFLTAFRRHERIHSNERPFKCRFCPKSFPRSCSLICHERVHTREKPFQCEVCGRAFSQDTHRKTHMRVHTREKPYSCQKCERRFSHSSTLKMHEKAHENPRRRRGRKPGAFAKSRHSTDSNVKNMCQFCGRIFAHHNNLVNHERVHTKEKPFKCIVCGKTFTQGAHCKTHMLVHTGEKPFQCKICGKAFALSGNCRAHEKIHNKTNIGPNIAPRSASNNSNGTVAQKRKNKKQQATTPIEVPQVLYQELLKCAVQTQEIQGRDVTIQGDGVKQSIIVQHPEQDPQGTDIILQLLESGSRVTNTECLVETLQPR